MPGYVICALQKFGNPKPKHPHHAPHKWIDPFYVSTQQQQPTTKSTTKPLDPKGITYIQSVNDTFIFYSQVDPCILIALNKIGSEQSKATTENIEKANWLMDYLRTYPNTAICLHTSNMILSISSHAAYLVQPKSCIRIAINYHLGWINDPYRVNGPINVPCRTLKNVVVSATESDAGGVFTGSKHGRSIITTLKKNGE